MAPNEYLFVNKHSNSPSLSRNTGSEASLASKVNKHVQQHRFWKSSGPRTNWYRPFVRSESSAPSSPTSSHFSFTEEVLDYGSSRSSREQGPNSPRNPRPSRRHSRSISRSLSHNAVARNSETPRDAPLVQTPDLGQRLLITPGEGADPFDGTVLKVTPMLREVLDRHLRWAVSSSVSDFAIKQGIKRIFESVLTDRMHSTAFMAMATAQQRKTSKVVLPREHSPEMYSYQATKLIREYIGSQREGVDPYTFVDIFRLAMCEWLNGNYKAARIHFAYIAQNYDSFKPQDASDGHSIEVISSEDLFLAIDVDEPPLIALCWEPALPAGPYAANVLEQHRPTSAPRTTPGSKLISALADSKLGLQAIVQKCLIGLRSFPSFHVIDFASATSGPIWAMKRRMHATLHQLQSVNASAPGVDACIRRTLIILLFLASTTAARRQGRTDIARLAGRLRTCILAIEASSSRNGGGATVHANTIFRAEPALWLWMYITGLAAAREECVDPDIMEWFRKRAVPLVVEVCGLGTTARDIESVLGSYLTIRNVHGRVMEGLAEATRAGNREPVGRQSE